MFELLEVFGSIIVVLSIFALLTMRFGVDSRDPFDSPEWERRQRWFSGQRHSWRD